MTRYFPLFFLLASCTTLQPADVMVTTKQIDAKTFDMTPVPTRTIVSNALDTKTTLNDAVMIHAGEVCPAGFDIVAQDTPDFILVQWSTTYRIRCH